MASLDNWSEEKSSAYLYNIIACYEKDPRVIKLFHDLAAMANKQALIWENELKKEGLQIPTQFKPSIRVRFIGKLIRYLGARRLRFILSAMKVRGMSIFSNDDFPYPYSAMRHEAKHKGINKAGNLRAAVFGMNDGIVSNMSLILGMAGATTNQNLLVLTGVAGLLAGACSMAAGEYISVRSQREFYEYQIDLEGEELKQYPEEEAAELSVIYQARGLPKPDADTLSKILINDPEKALDTLAREELGLNPNELGSPIGAAVSSFLSFSLGAFIPLIPFLLGNYHWNLIISISITGISLFSVGVLLSLFTNRSALISGLRMLLIGASAGIITYLIGHIIGVNLQ